MSGNNVVPMGGGGLELINELVEEQTKELLKAQELLRISEEKGWEDIAKTATRRIPVIQERLVALRAGYIPIEESIWFMDVHTKTRHLKRAVKSMLKNAPTEVTEIIEAAEKSGVFKKVKVGGGDPIVVGCAGGWNFLLATYLRLPKGRSVGVKCLPRS